MCSDMASIRALREGCKLKKVKSIFILIRNHLKATQIVFSVILLIGLTFHISIANAISPKNYQRIIKVVEDEFDRADEGKRRAIVTRPMNAKYLSLLKEGDKIDLLKLYEGVRTDWQQAPSIQSHITNALALAVSAADIDRLGKFMRVVTNPNDPNLFVMLYGQPSNLFHLALAPSLFAIDADSSEAKQEKILKVIDLLAATKLDINCTGIKARQKPPIALARPQLAEGSEEAVLERLGRAVLHGADPKCLEEAKDARLSLRDVVQAAFLQLKNKAIEKPALTPFARSTLKRFKEEEAKRIEEELRVKEDELKQLRELEIP
jgi:hypothetical protein